MMTDERRAAAAEKCRETYRRKRQRAAEAKAERQAQIDALRRVRDNPGADAGDVLRAVELLSKLAPTY